MTSRLGLRLHRAIFSDAHALAELGARTFANTYEGLDDPKDLADYVASSFSLEAMQTVLSSNTHHAFFALAADGVVGYAVLKTLPPPNCVTGEAPIELARFYLDRQFIGTGLGAPFLKACRDEARKLGGKTLWLSAYDRNVRAVEFYERHGFVKVGGREFLFGGRIYIDPVFTSSLV